MSNHIKTALDIINDEEITDKLLDKWVSLVWLKEQIRNRIETLKGWENKTKNEYQKEKLQEWGESLKWFLSILEEK